MMIPEVLLSLIFVCSVHIITAQEQTCSIDFTTELAKLLEEGTSEYRVATRASTYYSIDDKARALCSGRITQVWVVYKPSTSSVPYEIANMLISVLNITESESGLDTAQVGRLMQLPRTSGAQGSAELTVSHVTIDIPLALQTRIEAGQTIGVFINTNLDVSSGEGFPWLIGDVGDCYEVSQTNGRRTESLLPGMRFTITRDVVGQANQNPTSPTTSSNNTSSPSSGSFISSSDNSPSSPDDTDQLKPPDLSTTTMSSMESEMSPSPTPSVPVNGRNEPPTGNVSLAFIISPVVSAVFVIGVIIMIVVIVSLKKSDKRRNKSAVVYSVESPPPPAAHVPNVGKVETLGPDVQPMVIPFPPVNDPNNYEVMPSTVVNQTVSKAEVNYENQPEFPDDQKSNYYSTVSYDDQEQDNEGSSEVYEQPDHQAVFRTDSDYEDIWSDSEEVEYPFPLELYESAYDVQGPRTLPRDVGYGDEDYDDTLGPDELYSVPPSTEMEIYDELKLRNCTTVERETVKTLIPIGSGQFATVYKGLWDDNNTIVEVAVKTLSVTASMNERIKFLQEAHVMSQFNHSNIVKLVGVVPEGKPKMIVIELMPYGDLRKYLTSLVPPAGKSLSRKVPSLLLRFVRDVASGMKYLSLKGYIHRDLAARNVLLSADYVCKISDFGLTRDLTDDEIYQSRGGLIPLRWTAPEAITTGIYSPLTDVWSYGVLLYEIWSLGKRPFEEMENNQIIALLRSGGRLPPPPGCPKPMYTIMIDCWHPEPNERPDFLQIDCFLKKRNEELLWLVPEATDSVHTHALVLGSELSCSENLYPTLQHSYCM